MASAGRRQQYRWCLSFQLLPGLWKWVRLSWGVENSSVLMYMGPCRIKSILTSMAAILDNRKRERFQMGGVHPKTSGHDGQGRNTVTSPEQIGLLEELLESTWNVLQDSLRLQEASAEEPDSHRSPFWLLHLPSREKQSNTGSPWLMTKREPQIFVVKQDGC